MTRREFIAASASLAAATGMTYEKAMAQTKFRLRQRPSVVQGAQTLLNPAADLTFLGFIRFPSPATLGTDLRFGGNSTLKTVGTGAYSRLYMTGNYNDSDPLYELSFNGLTPNQDINSAPQMSMVASMGNFTAGHQITTGSGVGNRFLGAMLQDPSTGIFWWNTIDSYTGTQYPGLSASIINDTTKAITSYGPFMADAASKGHPMRGPMTIAPASFLAASGVSNRYMVSSSSQGSGNIACSFGCNARIWQPFDPTTQTPATALGDPSTFSCTVLNFHDYLHPQTRDTRYKLCGWGSGLADGHKYDCAINLSVRTGVGLWGTVQTPGDTLDQACGENDTQSGMAWVNTAGRYGVLFTGHLVRKPNSGVTFSGDAAGMPHYGYADPQHFTGPGGVAQECCHGQVDGFWGATGPWARYRQGLFWCYDPAQYAEVLASTRTTYGCTPTYDAVEMGQFYSGFERAWPSGQTGYLLLDNANRRIYQVFGPATGLDTITYGDFINGYPVMGVWSIAA